MALPEASPERVLKHQRNIDVSVYARSDGLWEVDARVRDIKTRDWPLASGLRPAGTPVHDMLLRLVIDRGMNVLESDAHSDWTPYPGYCDQYSDAYRRLVGLNLMRGFRRAVQERLGGTLGCTHLTELAQVLPTAVIQAFANEVHDVGDNAAAGAPTAGSAADDAPFQLDRCHALRRDAAAVALHYPRWYRRPIAQNPPEVSAAGSQAAAPGSGKPTY